LELKIGKQAFGGSNLYVLDSKQNKILLLKATQIENFEKANIRLYERDVTDVLLDEVTAAEIIAQTKTKKIEHTKKGEQGELQWSDEGEKGAVKPSYSSWMNKIAKLKIEKYATKEEMEALSKIEKFLVVRLLKNQNVNDELEFKKIAKTGDETTYWVSSKYLGHFAKISVSRMDSIEKDIATIFQ
jgi:hypothetical protein